MPRRLRPPAAAALNHLTDPAPPDPAATPAALLALDWGTTRLRASLLGAAGHVLAQRQCDGGVMAVRDGNFAGVLQGLCADWLHPARPVLASGMIGSRQGWVDAAYLPCPATLEQAAARLARVPLPGGGMLHVVPGLITHDAQGQADVMRGEETQLWGADLAEGEAALLPGTHSKWAFGHGAGDQGFAIERFATYMTGELYAVLVAHSILGRGMATGQADAASFGEGAALGLSAPEQATHLLFAARTAGLTGRWAPEALPDLLSGILIGIEVGAALRLHAAPSGVAVIGEAALAGRYQSALRQAGIASRCIDGAVAAGHGQWRIARAAGLVQ